MLWALFSLLMIATVLLVARPLFVRERRSDATEETVYITQLQEVDREEKIGLIPAEDAQLARSEIKRRLLNRNTQAMPDEETSMRRSDQFTLVGVVAVMALGSALLYSAVGSPSIAGSPHRKPDRLDALTPTRMPATNTNATATANGAPPVDELIGRLEARLELAPDDVEGWRMLGWSRFRTGDVEGARQAYKKAVELDPVEPNTLSAYGEALVRIAGGRVTDEAAAAFESARATNPNDPRARFLLGLKKEQDGNPQGALEDWLDLLSTSSPGDEWRDDVRSRIMELADQLGVDVSERLPAASPQAAPGPTQQQVSAAAEMSDGERQAMIEGMVSRLDQRLSAEPDDLDGWLRLIRARRVLGQSDKASAAVTKAKAQFSGNASAIQSIEAAATAPVDN